MTFLHQSLHLCMPHSTFCSRPRACNKVGGRQTLIQDWCSGPPLSSKHPVTVARNLCTPALAPAPVASQEQNVTAPPSRGQRVKIILKIIKSPETFWG